MPETDRLLWRPLIPSELAEQVRPALDGIQAFQDIWDGPVKSGLQVARLASRLTSSAVLSAPSSPAGLQNALQEMAERVQAFLASRVSLVFHHNLRRNPRFQPQEVIQTESVASESVYVTNGASTRVVARLSRVPRKGTLSLRLPGGTTVVDGGDGELQGTGVVSGTVDYPSRRIVLEMSAPIAAGIVAASYRDRTVQSAFQLPYSGTGISGWLGDIARTFPPELVEQSISGAFLVGGARAPEDLSGITRTLGLLFGSRDFLFMADTLQALGTQIGVSGSQVGEGVNWRFRGRLVDSSVMGPPHWFHAGLMQAVPPLGQLYSKIVESIHRLSPPPELSHMQDVVFCAMDQKMEEIDRLFEQISQVADSFEGLLSAAASSLYVLPLVEEDAGGDLGPLGWSSSCQVTGGEATAAKLASVLSSALWPDGEGGYTEEPPEALRGDAFVAGVGLIGLSGQNPETTPVGTIQPNAMQTLSSLFSLFGVTYEQRGLNFGAAVQEVPERPSTNTPIQAP